MSGPVKVAPEALESPTRLVTDVATQWLASMDAARDEDAERPKTQDAGITWVLLTVGGWLQEEKAHLLEELAELHTKMEEIKARAFATCVGVEARTPSELQSANKVLRRAIQKQQLECTKMHALMSEYSLFVSLKDTHSRRATLLALKSKVLEDGAKFLNDRRPRVDPLKPMREDHGYEASNGDFYASYISTMQFENTVKQVYDILLAYFSSIEISVSEKLGNITIREDDDNMAPGITQNRLVSTTIGGLRMESNTVYFSRYEPGDGDAGHQNGYGIFVADYVDDDDLNPYHPHERIRRDFTAVLELTSQAARLTGGRHGATGSLAPSFPQSQGPFQSLGAMPSPALLRAATPYNASTSSSPLSSSSSTAAELVDPAQPWVALMERRAGATPRQEYDTSTETQRMEQYNRLSRGDDVHYTAKKRGVEEQRPLSTSGEEGSSVKTEKPKRKRKLLVEVEELKAKIADLRSQTKVPFDENEEIMKKKFEAGRVLREGVQQRQQMFSQLSSIMSDIQSGSPLQDFIHLKNDDQSRHDTLVAIKASKMEKAQRFMEIRRPHLDPCNTMGEERRYEAENGDFCATRFTVTQFEEAKSVKQVFDLLLFYFCNIEISISEKIGHITIREDDGGDDKGIVQNRLVSITHKDVKMESNTVMFSQYYDRSTDKRDGQVDSSYGIIVADFVDQDERHPYVPDQRVRRDVNAVLEIREFVPQRPKSVAGGPPTRKSVVVLSRWVQNRMHYPKFPVCTDGWYELRDNMDLWGRALHRGQSHCIHAALSPTNTRLAKTGPSCGPHMQRLPMMHGVFPRGGTSSTTSSTTSFPLSDSAAPARSWASIIAPRPDEDSVDDTRQEDATALTHKEPVGGEQAPAQGDTGTESEETVPLKRKYPKRKHRKGTHTIRKVIVYCFSSE
ncbi:unnamed protein product [Phytophthora lilii]|uniref:Unnamed protein product n=1 Tax=Phytophthora lilii TaxID=2077276 RepID=A0A9W6U010_9STRA|nr:unnamed protein product [Phytophthora lilii]